MAAITKQSIKDKLTKIRAEADEAATEAQQARYRNNEKDAQYFDGKAQGLRLAALEIDALL